MTSPATALPPLGRTARILRAARLASLVACTALLFAGCVYLPHPPLPDPATLTADERAEQNEQIFDSAWNLVRRGYFAEHYNSVDWDDARARHLPAARAAQTEDELYGTINAMLMELHDPHTHALTARELEAMESAERVLLGLILRPQQPDQLTGPMLIQATIPGSTAAELGVEPGWVLVRCNGGDPQEVIGLGRLAENQVVTCTFLDHDGREREMELIARRLSAAPIMTSQVLDDGILLLRFDKFDGASARWLREQLKEHRDAPAAIVDLRFNPGGDAAALGRMIGEFFPGRVNMGTFITRRGWNHRLYAWRWFASARYDGPVAVLVSPASASSSEIFSAVLQYHGRARIFGEKTAGAVLASRFFSLPGGGRLQLSIDDYLTPDGKRLEGAGVMPDELIAPTLADLRARRDPVLEAALEYLRDALDERDQEPEDETEPSESAAPAL